MPANMQTSANPNGGNPGNPGGIGAGSLTSANWDVKIRHNFVKKVYSILSVQLAFTAGMIAVAVSNKAEFSQFVFENTWLVYLALGLTLFTICAISCCEKQARTTPNNYILLSIFTIFEAFLLGVITLRYDADEVLSATAITAGVVFALTLFAFQTKYDFTGLGPYLFVGLIALILVGIVTAFIPGLRWYYSAAGVLLFSFFLVYDTQMIIGGKHRKYQYSVDDYVFAALSLYLDIINLFLFILQLFGGDNR